MIKMNLGAVALAAAFSTSGTGFAQTSSSPAGVGGPSVPAPGGAAGQASAAPDAVTQPSPADGVTRQEFRGSPLSVGSPAANPFGGVQPGTPFGGPSPETGAAGVPVGGGVLYPALGVNLRRDDNIFFTNANRKSSTISTVTPVLHYEARTPNVTYDLVYKGDYASYWNSSADNFNDHQVLAQGNVTFSSRARLRVRGEYFKSHDPRGSTDRPSASEPDRFDAKSVSALFSYGSVGARGRIELEGGYLEKRYQNNRASTEIADRDVGYGSATFQWRVMPKTSLLFQLRDTEIDYKVDTQALDSSELRFLMGATWEATAKTTGIFKIGQVRKNFDASTRQDFTGVSWEGTVRWSPLTYSTVTLSTAREPVESSGTGDFILSQIYYLTWQHAWTERVLTAVNAGYRTDDFRGAATSRQDDTASVGGRLTYRFRRWLSISGEYTYTDRQSNAPFVEYNRNLFMLSVGATL